MKRRDKTTINVYDTNALLLGNENFGNGLV